MESEHIALPTEPAEKSTGLDDEKSIHFGFNTPPLGANHPLSAAGKSSSHLAFALKIPPRLALGNIKNS